MQCCVVAAQYVDVKLFVAMACNTIFLGLHLFDTIMGSASTMDSCPAARHCDMFDYGQLSVHSVYDM